MLVTASLLLEGIMVTLPRALSAVSLAVLVLTACGGGGGTRSVPAAGSSLGHSGSAALSVFVPSATSTSARRRYQLPPGTQSVEIVVTSASGTALSPPVAPIIANVSATTTGCSSVSGGISCTIDVTVPFGSLLFAVVGFSGQNATGNPIAWGYTTATISATASNAVAVSMSSVLVYVAMSLDGNISLVTVDHSANTVNVVNTSSDTTVSGTVAYLPNGDEKIVATASTDPGTPVGGVIYVRELAGTTFTFLSTGTTSPPVTGEVASGADWGIATQLTPCATTGVSYAANVAVVEGPEYQQGSNLTTGDAYQTGTVTISVSAGSATLGFSGNSYTINGTLTQAETGNSNPCSGGIFQANAGSNGSGEIAYDAAGVVVGANKGAGQPTSLSNGFAGFGTSSATMVSLSAVTAATYDGFIGGYIVGESTVKEAVPINAAPGGSNSLNACNYSNFEAGTVATSGCSTIAFTSQPQPGVLIGTVGGSTPAAFVVSQVSGKYVIFGVVGSENVALIQH